MTARSIIVTPSATKGRRLTRSPAIRSAYMISIPTSTPAALSGASSPPGVRRANSRHSSYTTSTIAPAPMAKNSVVQIGE